MGALQPIPWWFWFVSVLPIMPAIIDYIQKVYAVFISTNSIKQDLKIQPVFYILYQDSTVFSFLHKQVASGLTGPAQSGILALCEEVDSLSQQLSEMCRRGQGDTPQAENVAR